MIVLIGLTVLIGLIALIAQIGLIIIAGICVTHAAEIDTINIQGAILISPEEGLKKITLTMIK